MRKRASKLHPGDYVVKIPAVWPPNEFDAWGCGEGVGLVLPDQPDADIGLVDVQWAGGRATHRVEELRKVKTNLGQSGS
jgi:hypothetical protein